MITVLFACVHNAGRSQIAAALFNKYADPSKARAISAGTRPADRVHPEVITVMRSQGLDLTSQRPQRLTPELAATASWLITMGCGDECPIVPGAQRDDWPILRSERPIDEYNQRDRQRHRDARAGVHRGTGIGEERAGMSWVVVLVGGALGSAARHGVNLLTARVLGNPTPYATAAVNMIGSFAIGVLAGALTTERLTLTPAERCSSPVAVTATTSSLMLDWCCGSRARCEGDRGTLRSIRGRRFLRCISTIASACGRLLSRSLPHHFTAM